MHNEANMALPRRGTLRGAFVTPAVSNRRMRKTARPVVWEGHGAQSPCPHPIPPAVKDKKEKSADKTRKRKTRCCGRGNLCLQTCPCGEPVQVRPTRSRISSKESVRISAASVVPRVAWMTACFFRCKARTFSSTVCSAMSLML